MILLGWVSFFADVSSEMVYPLIPMLVVGVLRGSATTLGLIEGAAQMLVALLAAWAGWRSDRIRRRVPYINVGYALPALGKLVMTLAIAWPMVLVGRLIDRLGKGLRSGPRDALIADVTASSIRGRAFGFHRTMDTAGALVGVILSAAALWWLTGSPTSGAGPGSPDSAERTIRALFGLSVVLGALAPLLTLFIKEPEVAGDERLTVEEASDLQESHRPAPPARIAGRAALPWSYWRVVTVMSVFALANSSDTFLLLRAREVGLSPWAVVLAYAVCNIVYTAISYPAGALSDRLGRWKVIALGWTVYAVVYGGFAFSGARCVFPLFALYGIYLALTDGVGKALVADHSPPHCRGASMGIFYMATGLSALLASTVAGLCWDGFGSSAAFGLGAVMAAAALLLLPLLRPRRDKSDDGRESTRDA